MCFTEFSKSLVHEVQFEDPFLQTRKLKSRTQGSIASKWQGWVSTRPTAGLPVPGPLLCRT